MIKNDLKSATGLKNAEKAAKSGKDVQNVVK